MTGQKRRIIQNDETTIIISRKEKEKENMRKLSRKVWVMMLALALIISQLLPTGILAITVAAEDGVEIEEMKKEAPAAEEKKAEAAPVEEKKAEPAAEEKKTDEKAEAVKAEALPESLKEELKDTEAKEAVPAEEMKADEKAEEEKLDAEALEEKETEEKAVRDLMYFKKYNKMFSVDPVVYFDYDGQKHTLYPTFENVSKENAGIIDEQGRWIIQLKKLGDVYTETYYLTPKFVGVTTQTNAGTYKVGAVIEAAKVEDAYGNDVTSRVDANWGNNDYYTFGVVNYQGVIRPREISVRLNNVTKVYGQKDPDQSTWASVTKGSLASGDSLQSVLKLSRMKGEDVGDYPFYIKQASSGGSGNEEAAARKAAKSVVSEYAEYKEAAAEKEKIDFTEKEIIDAAEKEKEQAEAKPEKIGNYNITFENKEGKLTITPKPVTITALDNGKVKGAKDPVLTYKVEGLLDGESLPDGFVYDHKRAAGEEVGKYPIDLKINLDATAGGNSSQLEPGDVDVIGPIEWNEDDEEELEALEMEVAEKDFEECLEEVAYAEEVKEYAKKSVVKAAESAPAEEKKAEEKVAEKIKDAALLIERIEFERIDSIEAIEAVAIEQLESEDVAVKPDVLPAEIAPAASNSNNFKSKNYTFRLVKGTFTITGKSGGTTAGTTNNNGGNDGGDDIVVADVNDAATPAAAPAAPATSTTIPDAATPLAGGNGAWALVNLICTILAGLGAIVALFRRKEEEDENADRAEDEEDNRGRKMLEAKTAGILTAIAAVITFILTEDMRLPMILIDKWTILMVIMLAVQILAAALNKKAAEAEEEEEAETVSVN